MKAIERATHHYARNKRQWLDVPQWAGEDGKALRIFWELPTLATRDKARESGSDVEFIVALARNEDGSRMFDAEDALKLRDGADASIITHIAFRMLAGAQVSVAMVEQAVKN